MSTTPSPDAPSQLPAAERALVLGGGGSTGNAWLIGVVAGLLDGGVDVTAPDLVVGTSAGSTAAAQLAGAAPADLYAAALVPPPARSAGPAGARTASVTDHLARLDASIAAATDPADLRRRLGAAALDQDAASDGTWSARWWATVAARLPRTEWPDRAVLLTAVDARTGEPVTFDRRSGVDLVDAVAASCASGAAYAIGDGRYLDGGYRRNENADLASGCARVLVLAPFGGRTRTPLAWGQHLAAQVDELRAGGSRVATIVPDAGTEPLFGAQAMDVALRPDAARAGFRQGRERAEAVGALWA
ncbi:patatin-like phospholipase family protein [Cellulomonas hominis]|uniref:patatin-like phospholipase family protein n=1 Tax=Cellulomonas hominis TaxID=156981 RepID=UPI00144466A9|nr:patatin-like phospholipase family protein [Cellulomonas hominis]NKY10357.1 patatin-like phospholipase family protein [Cellulomonas hominis]